jgi:trans-2-enoyl-CoA reductase
MVLSTGLFVAAGFIFAKVRGVMKKLNVIEPLIEQIKALTENQNKFQLELNNKIDAHKKDVNDKLDVIKDEQYKIKDETHKIIMEYLFDLRKKTSEIH